MRKILPFLLMLSFPAWAQVGQIPLPVVPTPASAFFVATTGSDGNPGTLASPFATLGKCQSAMRTSPLTKTCYVRGGLYTISAATALGCNNNAPPANVLTLTHAAGDDGETFSYWPPDGIDSALFNGQGSIPTAFCAQHVKGVTVNGLSFSGFSITALYTSNWDADDGNGVNNTFTGNAVGGGSPGISASGWVEGVSITHNYLHDLAGQGIGVSTTQASTVGGITGATISGNVVYNSCISFSDCGPIYIQDYQVPASTSITVKDNYLYQINAAPGFFVATTGSDGNAGTIDAPFATISKCQATMRASGLKTCYIRAGTYNQGIALMSADNGELWSNYPPDGNNVILEGSNSPLVSFSGTANATIQGLNWTSSGGMCTEIFGGASNATIQNNNIGPCGVGNNTTQSAGILITGNSAANIYDNYIHTENQSSTCNDAYDNIEILTSTASSSVINIQGNVLAYGQNNILGFANAAQLSNLNIIGNFLLNPRGCVGGINQSTDQIGTGGISAVATAITVVNNYALSIAQGAVVANGNVALYASQVSDHVGVVNTTNSTYISNYIVGLTVGNLGCGLTVDVGSSGIIISNNKIHTQHCNIENVNGANSITGNDILVDSDPFTPANALITSTEGIGGAVCGPTTVQNNIGAYHVTGNVRDSWFNDGTCNPVTQSGNTFDLAGCTVGCTAFDALTPFATKFLPPLIPPQPKNCVARSPYSTQTSAPPC